MFCSLADEEEYELLPRHEVEMLKKEIEHLKKNPFGELREGEDLLEAVNNLNHSVNKLISIFNKADEDMARYYSEVNPLEEMKGIKEQNEQIAEGIVAVADMVKDLKKQGPDKSVGSLSTTSTSSTPRTSTPQTNRPGPGVPEPQHFSQTPQSQRPGVSQSRPFSVNDTDDIPPPPPRGLEGQQPSPEMPEQGKKHYKGLFKK